MLRLTQLLFASTLFLVLISCKSNPAGNEIPDPPTEKTLSIGITNPSDGSEITRASEIDIEISVTTNDELEMLKYFIDDVQTDSTDRKPYQFLWDASDKDAYPAGQHTLKVNAETKSGLHDEAIITFTIVEESEEVSLSITIDQPTDGSTVTRSSSIEIKTTVSSNEGISLVLYNLNQENIGYAETEPYDFTWDASNAIAFPAGNYTLQAVAESISGKTDTSETITITLAEPASAGIPVTLTGNLKTRVNNLILSDFEVVLNDQSVYTDAEGSYLLQDALPQGTYTITTVGTSDLIPIQYSFDLTQEKEEEIPLYAYEKVQNINSKPGDFIKGVSLFDAGPWMKQDLYPDDFSATFDRLENMNTNLVTFFDPVFVTVAGDDSVKMSTSANTYFPWDMLSTNEYKNLTTIAGSKGMNFMWWFGVWPQDEKKLNGKSFNEIVFSGQQLSDEFWEDWFAEYTKYLKMYAMEAEVAGVPHISLGHGLNYATSPFQFSSLTLYNNLWTNMINEIRSVYTGKLVYFGTHRPFTASNYEGGIETEYYEDDGYSDTFKQLFDMFGIIVSNITETDDPRISTIKSAVISSLNRYSDFNKPLLLWIWASSVDGSANIYGHLEPVLDVGSAANNFVQDFYEQADIYEGIMEAVNETSVNIKGVISHGYMYHDWFRKYEPRNMDTAFQKASSVRGKPAEKILEFWYRNW